jgi:hypothetical protein
VEIERNESRINMNKDPIHINIDRFWIDISVDRNESRISMNNIEIVFWK